MVKHNLRELCLPHCKTRPYLDVETVDAGHYSSPTDWTNSVSLQKWKQGFPTEKENSCLLFATVVIRLTTCGNGTSVAGEYGLSAVEVVM